MERSKFVKGHAKWNFKCAMQSATVCFLQFHFPFVFLLQWRLLIIISRASKWGTLKSAGNPRSSCRNPFDLHWLASARPGRGWCASVSHRLWLSLIPVGQSPFFMKRLISPRNKLFFFHWHGFVFLFLVPTFLLEESGLWSIPRLFKIVQQHEEDRSLGVETSYSIQYVLEELSCGNERQWDSVCEKMTVCSRWIRKEDSPSLLSMTMNIFRGQTLVLSSFFFWARA